MQPFMNKPVSASAPEFKARLRQDQMRAIQSLLLVGLGILFLSLYHATWVSEVVWGVAIACSLLLGASGYFWGRFHVGQHLLLESVATPSARVRPSRALVSEHKVQAYVSMEEARQHGWTFFDLCGRHGNQPIPRWAHDGRAWFEYDGLDTGRSTGVGDQRRVFGVLVYQLSPVAPGAAIPMEPQAA